MSFMLIITQPQYSEPEVAAVVRAAIAVLGLRAEASHARIGTFVRRARAEQWLSLVRLTTTGEAMPAASLARALDAALAAAGLETADVQVLDERAA